MSVCCFCQNIFGRVVSRAQNFLIWASMGIVTSIYVISFGVCSLNSLLSSNENTDLFQTLLFSCSSISSLFNLKKLGHRTECVNLLAEQLALAVINAVTDWLIMYLPVVLIKQSMLDRRQKSEPHLSAHI
jgi:hypothetical protein